MKDEKKSRKEEGKRDPYDKLTESLMKKGLVSAMISMQPRTEELKTERMEERKSERIQVVQVEEEERVKKIKKNYYVSEDSVILLEVMANVEDKKQGELIEEMIIDRFKRVYPTYDKLDKEVFKQKYLPKLSKKAQEEHKDILE